MALRDFIKVILPIVALAAGGAAHAAAGKGEQRLDAFMNNLHTMRAAFVQTLMDPDGHVREESEGELLLSRPGRFRLDYSKPYQQIYVADGKQLWMYDKDLEQVTVRPENQALGSTPALLLSGTEPLSKSFKIVELGDHEGFTWVELRPRAKDANFNYVRLALEPKVLRAMEMVDGFGQTTRLYFDKIDRNPKLSASKFVFTPPPGVDVVGDKP